MIEEKVTDQTILNRAESNNWKTEEEKSAKSNSEKVRLLLKHISDSQTEARDWTSEVKEAWREFQAQNTDGKYRKLNFYKLNSYNRYWADTMTILPSIYCSPPKTVARRRFDKDLDAKTASIIMDRFAKWILDSQPIGKQYTSSALEYLNASRATGRVFYCHDIQTRKERAYVTEVIPEPTQQYNEQGFPIPPSEAQPPAPIYLDTEGKELPEGTLILEDEAGELYYEKDVEEKTVNPRVTFKALHFDQWGISPGARDFTEVWFQWFKFTITRKEAYEIFGDVVEKVPSSVADESKETNLKSSKELFTYYEFWNKSEKRVYFIHELYKDDFLKEEKDLYELENFFPTPSPLMTNERYDNCYPTPDYTLTRDVYEQLHILAKRINRVTKAIKGVMVYDGSISALDSLFTELLDEEGIAVANFKDLMGQGGLDVLVQLPPYERMAAVLNILTQAFATQKADLDELRGISDIIRGQSDPITSATAEKIKKQMSTNRNSVRQKEMVRYVRDSIEMMVDLGFKTFSDEQIKEIVGYNFMDDEDKKRFDPALVICRNDKSRMVRMDIETDSLTAVEDQDNKEAAAEMMNAVGAYVQQTIAAVEQNQSSAPIMFKLLELAISQFDFSKNAVDELNEMFQTIQDKLKNPPEQAPPPPDPKLLQIESNERIRIAELQTKKEHDIAVYQANQVEKDREFQLKIAELNQKAEEARQASYERQQALQVQIERLQVAIQTLMVNSNLQREKNAQEAFWWNKETEVKREANLLDSQIRSQELNSENQRHVDNVSLEVQRAEDDKEKEALKTLIDQNDKKEDRAIESTKLNLEAVSTQIEAENKERDNERLEGETQAKIIEALKSNTPNISIGIDTKTKKEK